MSNGYLKTILNITRLTCGKIDKTSRIDLLKEAFFAGEESEASKTFLHLMSFLWKVHAEDERSALKLDKVSQITQFCATSPRGSKH